jgi:hypothetical protein
MEKILEKARMMLRTVYVALGATAMPFLIHAAYGMRQPDPDTYTVPLQGRVVHGETGEPVAGIRVRYNNYVFVDTGSDGRFLIYVPEEDVCSIMFHDVDGFENSGFFLTEYMEIARDEIEDPLEVSLRKESQVVVIRGTVRSNGIIGKPASGIRVSVSSYGSSDGSRDNAFHSGFEVFSDEKGRFSIQAPERDVYYIDFFDAAGLFQGKGLRVAFNEIKRPLRVKLDKTPGE